MPMNTWKLECFVCVARTLNFRKAAEVLHVTQPALTKQINALEASLGVRLLERNTAHVSLTDEGYSFYEKAVPLLEKMNDLEHLFDYGPHVVYNYFYAYGVGEIGKRYRAKRPETVFNMLRLRQWGDMGPTVYRPGNVVFCRNTNLQGLSGVEFVPLYDAREYLMVRKDDPYASKRSITLDEIVGRTIIRSGSELSDRNISSIGTRIENILGRDRRWVGCNRIDETVRMIEAGCGVAFAAMPVGMTSPDLALIPLEPYDPFTLGLAYAKANLNDDVSALVDVLVEVYGDSSLKPVLG